MENCHGFPPPLFVFVGTSLQQDTDKEEVRKDLSLKTQKWLGRKAEQETQDQVQKSSALHRPSGSKVQQRVHF